MKRKITAAALLITMLIMILDTGTMLSAMEEGISLCLRSLIPSIFPFMLLSAMLTNYLLGAHFPLINILERFLNIPEGFGSIFAIGLLGGYPIGAQCIGVAVETGSLSPADGRRMLCCCSNAGPAFLFGFGISILGHPLLCWYVWLIQFISACIMAHLTPASAGKYHCDLKSKIQSIQLVYAFRLGHLIHL